MAQDDAKPGTGNPVTDSRPTGTSSGNTATRDELDRLIADRPTICQHQRSITHCPIG
ncbi:MAG: hypothetical protein AAGF28_12600 [Pseudomonadota bacterium]